MTKSNDCRALRDQWLRDSSGGECLSLAHIDHVAQGVTAGSARAHQGMVMDAIRAMLDDGLVVVGYIAGGSDESVEPWDMSLDDAMARIHDEYVVRHDDGDWVFRTWFALTESGEEAARALETKKSEG